MDRLDLVLGLAIYPKGYPEPQWKGQLTLASYLCWWFKNELTNDHELDGILVHLTDYLVEAMECFRISSDEPVVTFRDQYLKETGREEFPNLTDISAGLDRVLIVSHIAHLMAAVTGWKGAVAEIEGYFRAEDKVLDQAIQVFMRRVWRTGMWKMIKGSTSTGMSGRFDQTEFGTYYSAGRVMVTFARPSLSDNTESVSFVADHNDQSGIRTGLQSAYASLKIALEMIKEVTLKWPLDTESQKEVFKTNETIAIL